MYKIMDLFCGCGGFSLGFRRAGFNICCGIDVWTDAIATFSHNFPEAIVLSADLNMVTGESLYNLLSINPSDIDVIVGGPPCQGFSVSGKRNENDPRNNLYKSFVQIVASVKPSVFILENVPGLIRLYNGKAIESILSDFSTMGYNITYRILSADNFGVPQKRRRVFIVGINIDKIKNTHEFIFPEQMFGEENPPRTCKDAISDLDFIPDDRVLGEDIEYKLSAKTPYQEMMRSGSTRLLNHSVTLHTARTKEIIAMVPDGGNYKTLPQELQRTRKVNIAWTRMNSNKPCFTIDTGHNHHFHYRANRVPTVRESARIQSFPDTFEFIGIKTSQLKQVGNAVPPLLVEALANEVKNILDKG